MDLVELEELLSEYMPAMSIEKNRKGEVVIYTNLKEADEGGELVPLDDEEVESDPDFGDDIESYDEDDSDEE
jgi:hypothetical protein